MAKFSKNTSKVISKNLFPVVGIGASAGGLEAFKKLIKAIPLESGMAFILVQHLHPEHNSTLPEILQRETAIPVQEVTDNIKVKPNHIYIIPSNKILVANDGVLQLSARPKDQKNMPIDIFFSSLAEVHQAHSIGIVLSGTGADGTSGLRKIKDQGGITFAQEPASAAYDDMPLSAIKAEVTDFILSPEKMPSQLMQMSGTIEKLELNDPDGGDHKKEEACFRQILSLIRLRFGADFMYYKQTTIRRRILRRIAILKLQQISDYLKYLQQTKDEQNVLFYDLLIPVTSFFRDPRTFEHLSELVFPEITKEKTSANPLRVWIAGCSTGEEAYSMAIALYEFLSDKISSVKIQIFATDLSENAITKARAGMYSLRQMEGVSDQRLHQFFYKTDWHYHIKKIIRDMCVFATHNFLKDPPFAKMDFISCRNVLIYMEPFLQKKAFSTFHYSLNEKGFLLLGKSESTGNASEYFSPIGIKEKLFTRKSTPGRFVNSTSSRKEELIKDRDYGLRSNERKKDDFQKNADEIILSKYGPAGVIVNEEFDIVQFRGLTGDYLEPAPGKATLNVLKMAKEGLSFELRNALHKVKSTNKSFSKEGIPLLGGQKLVCIEVIGLPDTIDPHYLILFTNQVEVLEGKGLASIKNRNSSTRSLQVATDARYNQLEEELAQAREDMRSITEEQEAANEELQSANEELLSGSEELQSLNEELETSKEELQSTNEELLTVNQELFDRNEQYNTARTFAETIVATIHEPLMVLNADFSIRSANKSFYSTFSLTENETLGYNLFELQNKSWDLPDLRKYLLQIRHGDKRPDWEITHVFPHIGEHTICFNGQIVNEDSGRQSVLLALNDITERKEAEKLKSIENLKIILDSIPQITYSASAEGKFAYFNNYFLEYSGMSLAKALKNGWLPILNPDQINGVTKAWDHSIRTLDNLNIEFQLKRKRDGMYRWHVCRSSAIIADDGTVNSWVGSVTDIEDQKSKEKAKDEFISIASHELKTPLSTAKAFIQLVEFGMRKKNNSDLIFATKASASIGKLEDLIKELLDVSKIQHGKLGLRISTFNFNEMLTSAIESVQIISEDHDIILSGKVEPQVSGDRDRLQQVVINLLTNAVKYSLGSGQVFVDVSLKNKTITVAIKDTGIGINKKHLNKVFDRYYREEGRNIQFQGLGIGLSISKEIILRHNGKIWAESELGKGSTFYFTLSIEK
jgi:two-component system, chemotaxis family, CheB/CheR fusion protein